MPFDLRATLKRLGLSQAKLAKRLGVHVNTVSGWMRGETPAYAIAWLDLMDEYRDYRKRVQAAFRSLGDAK